MNRPLPEVVTPFGQVNARELRQAARMAQAAVSLALGPAGWIVSPFGTAACDLFALDEADEGNGGGHRLTVTDSGSAVTVEDVTTLKFQDTGDGPSRVSSPSPGVALVEFPVVACRYGEPTGESIPSGVTTQLFPAETLATGGFDTDGLRTSSGYSLSAGYWMLGATARFQSNSQPTQVVGMSITVADAANPLTVYATESDGGLLSGANVTTQVVLLARALLASNASLRVAQTSGAAMTVDNVSFWCYKVGPL